MILLNQQTNQQIDKLTNRKFLFEIAKDDPESDFEFDEEISAEQVAELAAIKQEVQIDRICSGKLDAKVTAKIVAVYSGIKPKEQTRV